MSFFCVLWLRLRKLWSQKNTLAYNQFPYEFMNAKDNWQQKCSLYLKHHPPPGLHFQFSVTQIFSEHLQSFLSLVIMYFGTQIIWEFPPHTPYIHFSPVRMFPLFTWFTIRLLTFLYSSPRAKFLFCFVIPGPMTIIFSI